MNQRPTQSVHGTPLLEYVEWGESFDQAMSPLMNPKTTAKDHTAAVAEPRVDYTRRSMVLIDADSVSRAELATAIGEFGTPLQSFADITSIEGSKNLFDLVILGPGSIEISSSLVKQVRTVDPSACLPIVLIGTVACLAGMTQALLAGADDYVAWPCSREVLRARMEGLLAARLRSEFALVRATDRVKHLERALDSNRVIGTALGILMATQKITSEEAFMCLKRASQHSNRKLREIAEDVIYTGALTEMA